MFEGPDDLLAYVKKEGIEMIDVRFCDLIGVMQHFTVPAREFDKDQYENGLAFDGSSIRGFQKINESDMALLPDPTTAWIDPFRERKTLIVNFNVHDPITKEAYSRDPRNIARKAEAYLTSTGIGDTAFSPPRPSSTSSTTFASTLARTPRTTPSTPRLVPGTPDALRTAATAVTR